MLAQRLRSSGRAIFRTVRPRAWGGGGSFIFGSIPLPNLKRKASNTWLAVRETYLSTKQVFESHRVVFTIGTSIASILTAWTGYSLRQHHQSQIEKRLGSIEEAMQLKNNSEHQEIKKIVSSGNVSTAACIATAWTSLVIGPLKWERVLPTVVQIAEIHIMVNNLPSSLPWVLFFVCMINAALGVGKDPSSSDGTSGSGSLDLAQAPTSTDNGTCKSRVEIYGYECEEHHVTTKDGYILSIQRIPNGRSAATQRARKTPVLLQHGVFMDGITWLLNLPHESLGYILADEGYDVWISNGRGTKYSLQHTTLSHIDPAYWEWSWDELVAFDLPATFEYVYRHAGHQKLHYVGHSLGTLMVLASFCEHHLLHMVRSAALLSPIAYMNQVRSPIARGAAEAFTAEIYYWLGIYEFNPLGEAAHKLLSEICRQPGVDCYDIVTSFTGKNCCLNTSTVEIFLKHEPQPTATKNIIHLSQMIRRGTITKYDYGNQYENMKHYGQDVPPAYNMSSIPNDLPLFLTYGGRDYLSVVGDVEHLLQRLELHAKTNLIVAYHPQYAHADFVMAVNANRLVYDPLIAFFKLH